MGKHYDLLVIGTGAAGSTAASSAANGAHVALIERDKIGGTCLNYGCDPTKTLLHSAAMLYRARHAAPYGLRIPSASFDWEAVEAYTREVIKRIRGGTLDEVRADMAKKGVELIKGEASFVSPHASSWHPAARRLFRLSRGWRRQALLRMWRRSRSPRCHGGWRWRAAAR
ncbi:MAG TPA: FAD-dependent oxidoreductase [Ktedonosporobacter sp.]|jgi:pyruvate/2-oxoglutarate dehydrogenase complex dihydrolipoamide dehydrogenase (E3) component|nr:FAD-dependent oxidoreductase [Ktedonosporobacter sp.]